MIILWVALNTTIAMGLCLGQSKSVSLQNKNSIVAKFIQTLSRTSAIRWFIQKCTLGLPVNVYRLVPDAVYAENEGDFYVWLPEITPHELNSYCTSVVYIPKQIMSLWPQSNWPVMNVGPPVASESVTQDVWSVIQLWLHPEVMMSLRCNC